MTARADNQKNNDTMLKVVALICALLLWFYAEAQENPSKERQLTVPVQYINLAEDYVVENPHQSVQVIVKGNETDIMSLRSDDFTAVVDLSGATMGSASYPVAVNSTAVSERFTYMPDKVTVSIDQIQQKTVPVHLRTDGAVAQYYELQHTDVQPDSVTIRGTGKRLAEITAVETAVVDIAGLKQYTELETMLVLPEGVTVQNNEGVFSAEGKVAVLLSVQPVQSSRTLETVISLRNIPLGLTGRIDQDKATIVLTGDAELLETQPILDQLLFYADCDGLTAGEYSLPVQVDASNEAVHGALQSVFPQMVNVTLTAGYMELPESTGNDFAAENVDDNHVNDENNTAE